MKRVSVVEFLKYCFFSSRRRHTRCSRDWSSDVCSSDLPDARRAALERRPPGGRGSWPPCRRSARPTPPNSGPRSEERRVGKSVDLGGRRIIKKKKKMLNFDENL